MVYRFESFVFDPDAAGLLESGQPVALEPQVFSLLKYLVENRGRIVSKDELIDEIWQGRAISDAALNTRIRAVRRALGDDRAQQKYLRTYPKRGFQFVAPVAQVSAEEAASAAKFAAASAAADSERAHRRRSLPMLAGLGVLFFAIAAGGWWMTREAAKAPKLSIAVLPFENLSADPEQGYFADAFTEDLITDLSRIRDAFVIARRTSFTYKDRAVDIATVAEELGVRYVLEGSVRRMGDEVRINVQLIDGETNRHIWSDRFDRTVTEVFSGQYEVTGQIASALKAELREADLRRQGPPESLEAWDYALKGNVLLVQPKQDFRGAKELFEKAIALDPNIASAWSGLAFIYFVASFDNVPGVTEPNSKNLSLQAAQRAVALDPKNAEGHWMVGFGYTRNGQTDLAWPSCQTAMELNPNNDCGYVCAGLTKMAMGEPAEAIPYLQHSVRLNPGFRAFTKFKYMGVAYVQNGQDAEAIEVLNRALAKSPDDTFAYMILTAAQALDGRTEAVQSSLQAFLSLSKTSRPNIASMRQSNSWLGPGFARVLEGLRVAGLPEN
jgi:TolB-like protein/DNA-binding winged helix-turn-helix (wHTH) protein/Tfp pilus assembly protein PilF